MLSREETKAILNFKELVYKQKNLFKIKTKRYGERKLQSQAQWAQRKKGFVYPIEPTA